MAEFMQSRCPGESFAEATSYFPSPNAFALGPDQYLEHLRRVKDAVEHSRHRVAERSDARRLARIRAADGSRPARTRWN